MPIVSAEPIRAQIYRISYMVCQGVIENIIVTPDGLYHIHYIKNGHIESHTGKIINVVPNRASPNNSYLLFDYSCDRSGRRERILFYQIQMMKDVTPNDAYNIALKHGFTGTVDEWLESLKGPRGYNNYELAQQAGFTGTLEEYLGSLKGDPGKNGKSAYELAVELGYTGTLAEYLDALKGEAGKSSYDLAVEHGFTGTVEDYLESLNGKSAYKLAVEQGFEGTLEEWYAKNGDTVLLQDQVDFIKAKISWEFSM